MSRFALIIGINPGSYTVSEQLANLLANRLIARTDVKALQYINSEGRVVYMPVRERLPNGEFGNYIPWTRDDLNAHIAGTKTFGHYLVNLENQCKIICFDIDLRDKGFLPTTFGENGPGDYIACDDLRQAWHQRNHPARGYMKAQFRTAAHILARDAEMLGMDVAVAYSGNKGLHVYVMSKKIMTAQKARAGAAIILDDAGRFVDEKNGSGIFYGFTDKNPDSGFPNLSIEVFPKQDTVDPSSLGNLVRLPLGKNLKHSDPTFFVDMSSPIGALQPVDAIRALTRGYSLWQSPEEANKMVQATTATAAA